MTKYYYFFSFVSSESNGAVSFGNIEYTLHEKITSLTKIQEIEDNIASIQKLNSCVVINYQLLREEEED